MHLAYLFHPGFLVCQEFHHNLVVLFRLVVLLLRVLHFYLDIQGLQWRQGSPEHLLIEIQILFIRFQIRKNS